VTTATLPRTGRSLIGRLVAACGQGQLRAAAAKAAAAAREYLPVVAGLGGVDYGAFRAAAAAGWIVTGVTVLLFDFYVRG
jgi:hypothetical protein